MPMSTEETYQYNVFKEKYEEWKGKIEGEIEKNAKWIDLLVCEAFKCHTDGPNKGQPIYNANGNLPDKSKIDLLEERIEALEVPQGGRRTRGKLRAKSRAKSRKKRRKSRRRSKGRKRRRKNLKKRTKRRR